MFRNLALKSDYLIISQCAFRMKYIYIYIYISYISNEDAVVFFHHQFMDKYRCYGKFGSLGETTILGTLDQTKNVAALL